MRRTVLALSVLGAALAFGGTAAAQGGDVATCASGTQRDQAIAACTRLIQSDRHNSADLSALYSNRGIHYRLQGKYDLALADQAEAIRLNPQNSRALHNHGIVLYSQGVFARAVEDFTRAVAIDPRFGLAFEHRGFARHRLGRYDEAIRDYDTALPMLPGRALTLYARSLAWRRKGDLARADADLVAARAIQADVAERFTHLGLQSAPGVGGAPQAERRISGNGTGFFVTADGYIVTNAHVVRPGRRYSIWRDGRELPLSVIDVDQANDLALAKVESRGRPIAIAPAPPAKGEDVAALGYPVADALGKELKATFGKINALSGPRDHPRYLQTDTAVQPGSSGGPLLNMRGEVVGIVTASFSTAAAARRIGSIPQNVNYAVKAEYLVPLLEKNISGKWRRGSGVRFGSTAELVRQREPSVVLIVIR